MRAGRSATEIAAVYMQSTLRPAVSSAAAAAAATGHSSGCKIGVQVVMGLGVVPLPSPLEDLVHGASIAAFGAETPKNCKIYTKICAFVRSLEISDTDCWRTNALLVLESPKLRKPVAVLFAPLNSSLSVWISVVASR